MDLYLDIETAPDDSEAAIAEFESEVRAGDGAITAPGNYKDPQKIADCAFQGW